MEPYAMVVLPAGDTVRVEAETPARVMLIGGEPLDGPRFIWWNFVSSRRDRITDAASEWSAHQTPRIEGESDWVAAAEVPPALAAAPCGSPECVHKICA